MKTKAGESEYKGNELFAVYKEDENGDISEMPLVSFGKRKAQALLNHLEEFEKWCEVRGIEKQD